MDRPVAHPGRVHITPYGVVCVTLGLILLSAAGLKGHQLATEPVVGTGLLTSRWFLIAVVEFELFFGLWLWFGLYPRRTWQLALLCFSTFGRVTLYKALSGEATCGCFGRVPVNPWYTLALDLAAVVALLGLRPAGITESSPRPVAGEGAGVRAGPRRQLACVVGISLLVGIPAARTMASYQPASLDEAGDIFGDSEFVVLEPEKWVGKRFPLLKYIDVGESLARGEWIVLLHREGCRHCEQAIPKSEQLAEDFGLQHGTPRMPLVEVPRVAGRVSSRRSSACVLGMLTSGKAWFLETPLEVRLEKGMVVQIIQKF